MNFETKMLLSLLVACLCVDYARAGFVEFNGEPNFPDLATFKWLHGAKSCKSDTSPRLQVEQVNKTSYILRQNKCTTFEAPFIYVLVGSDRVLVVDTGANESPEELPLLEQVRSILAKHRANTDSMAVLVIHTHSHSDHTKGDSQFIGVDGVEVVGTNNQALATQLGLTDWPNNVASLDLGGRQVTLIPIPGHQEQSIAIYDKETGWLLTGDTLYPGLIRVKNWAEYQNSIERLTRFSETNKVSLILGAHIEMNGEENKIYSIGTLYQPKELPLALNVNQLHELDAELRKTPKPKKLIFESFVVSPLNRFEKMLIKVLTKRKPD